MVTNLKLDMTIGWIVVIGLVLCVKNFVLYKVCFKKFLTQKPRYTPLFMANSIPTVQLHSITNVWQQWEPLNTVTENAWELLVVQAWGWISAMLVTPLVNEHQAWTLPFKIKGFLKIYIPTYASTVKISLRNCNYQVILLHPSTNHVCLGHKIVVKLWAGFKSPNFLYFS